MPRDRTLDPSEILAKCVRGAAAGVLLASLGACGGAALSDAEIPEVSLAGMNFTEVGLFEQGFILELRLKNPNDFDIPVDALDFALDVNGAPFAEGLTNEDFVLPASAEIVVPIDVSIATQDLIERVTSIGTGRRLEYQLTGSADIGSWFNSSVPFDRSGKLVLPDISGLFPEEPATG